VPHPQLKRRHENGKDLFFNPVLTMPLLPSEPGALTLEEKQARTLTSCQALIARNWATMINCQNDGIDLIWRNAFGLTPQEAISALGTDAVQVFAFHSALTQLLAAQAAADGVTPNLKFPTFAFAENQDGTITVDPETPYGS
jgi:hypothetical protein